MTQSVARQLVIAVENFRGGNLVVAEKLLRRILAHEPLNSQANELLGYIAGNRGQLDYSFELLKVATSAPNASAEAFYYFGKHFLDKKLFENAVAAFRQSLQRAGDFYEGLHDLGVALAGCGKPEVALGLYDKALALNPASYQALFNKGVALDDLKRFDEALHNYDQALSLNPDFAVAWHNRGATLNDLTRINGKLASQEMALASFGKALALEPDIPYLLGDWLQTRMNLCLWETDDSSRLPGTNAVMPPIPASDIEQQFEACLAGIDAKRGVTTPLLSLSIPASPGQQRRCAEIYVQDKYPSSDAYSPQAKHDPQGRIRVGYFSPDFRLHAVSFLTAGMFEHHDRARFETHAFALGAPGDDPMTRRLHPAFDHFHDVGAMPDQDIVLFARTLGIDIAVDLAGHTQGARTGVFARRVAPIQINYLGYPGSMGAEFIDYIIADKTVIPEIAMNEYTEKIVFLPHCFQVNDSRRSIAAAPLRVSCGLDDRAFVFCSFNSIYKLNPRLFDSWMNILRQTEHSVLWLLGENDAQMQNLRHWAAARSVSLERLVFAGRLPYAEHLARYQLADLVLDTLPFNGGTTTSDALWGGAPVLTCTGATFAGRMATSLLLALGLPELIAQSLDAYQEKALDLANNPLKLAELKKKLAANRDTSPLFNTRLLTRHIEDAYARMWRHHQAGQAPEHLWISPLQCPAIAEQFDDFPVPVRRL